MPSNTATLNNIYSLLNSHIVYPLNPWPKPPTREEYVKVRIKEIKIRIEMIEHLLTKAKKRDRIEFERQIFDLRYELIELENPEIIDEVNNIVGEINDIN